MALQIRLILLIFSQFERHILVTINFLNDLWGQLCGSLSARSIVDVTSVSLFLGTASALHKSSPLILKVVHGTGDR